MDLIKNKKGRSIAAGFCILALILIVAFVAVPFPKNGASVISFVFTIISLAFGLGVTMYIFAKGKSLTSSFYGFPILRIAYIYPIIQFIICALICILSPFWAVPLWIALVLSVVLLGLSAIGVIAADNTRDIIESNEAETERVTKAVKFFNLNIASIVDLCKDQAAAAELRRLQESFRYSDPVSGSATEQIENVITEKLDSLKRDINDIPSADAIERISEIDRLLKERNRLCKAGKR